MVLFVSIVPFLCTSRLYRNTPYQKTLTFDPLIKTAISGLLLSEEESVDQRRGFFTLFGIGLLAGTSLAANANTTTTTSTATSIFSLYYAADGAVQYVWSPPGLNSANSLGSIEITSKYNNKYTQFYVPLLVQTNKVPLYFQSSERVTSSGTVKLLFSSSQETVSVTLNQTLSGKRLSLTLQSSAPVLTSISYSVTPNSANISPITLPYYSWTPIYLPDTGVFENGYFDWQYTNATQLQATKAVYAPLTNGQYNTAKEQLVLSVSDNLADVLPIITNPASPYMAQVAGKTVLDIWSQQSFSQIAQELAVLGDYGMNNCVVLIHNWQENGYDNALPAQYPANAEYGGNTPLQQAVATVKALNCFAAVHENYVDYYPNYPFFQSRAVVLNSDSSFRLGWLNPSTGVQSFQTKPNWFITNAQTQSPEIHSGIGTNAAYLDVDSASFPEFRVDMDATQPGAGMLSTSLNANVSLWNYERQAHGGPVFGEGMNHWYWSGLLDGVEAQFGAGNNVTEAENNPLFVDFDLLQIHPLQVNHGMGLYERWVTSGENIANTNLLDAYRMQELIFGHAPYIGDSLWTNVPRVLLEQNLVSPVAQRYGTQTVSAIRYQVNGTWTDSNAATNAKNWSRVEVQYGNGDTIVANAQTQTLNFNGWQLPQYGWAAFGNNMVAFTALLNGQIGDYSQTASSYFANARNQTDLTAFGDVAQPVMQLFQQTGVRSATFGLQWKVMDGTNGLNLVCFVHFVNSTTGAIAFQGDHSLSTPTMTWLPGQAISDNGTQLTIPSGVPDGTYSVRVGLYDPTTGIRYLLMGTNDGTERYILGNLTVLNGGQTLTFTPQAMSPPTADPRLNSEGTVMNFSSIQTDGMVSIQLNEGFWVLRAYPRWRDVVVELNQASFPKPPSVTCDSKTVIPTAAGTSGYWQIHTQGVKSCQWTKP